VILFIYLFYPPLFGIPSLQLEIFNFEVLQYAFTVLLFLTNYKKSLNHEEYEEYEYVL